MRTLYDLGVTPVTAGANAPIALPACPVCAARTARPRYALEGSSSRLVVCDECGLGRLHPLPDAAALRALYPDAYYSTSARKFEPLVEAMVRVVGARHVRYLARGLEPGARVLDVGCGRGVVLGVLADYGFEAHGLDISAAAVHGADPRAIIRIADRLTDADYPTGHFDLVILWHVLEHLSDPRETMLEIHRILKPGGRVVVALPNFSSLQARWAREAWFHLDLPRHLYHFPLAALVRLLTNCGFESGPAHHFSLRQNPFGWVQSALNRLPWLPRNGLYVLLQPRDRASSGFSARTRLLLRAAYVVGMPLGLLLSLAATLLRTGATVHVVATRART